MAASVVRQLRQKVFTAGNGAGSRTCTGARIGDRVVCVFNHTDGTDNSADFEAKITIVDKIQQTATNLSSDVCLVTLVGKGSPRL